MNGPSPADGPFVIMAKTAPALVAMPDVMKDLKNVVRHGAELE